MRSARAAMPQLDMPKNLILLARTVHLGMYASLALIAVTGLMIGGLYNFGIKDGLVLEAILLLHEIIFWTSVNLMGLHIVGAWEAIGAGIGAALFFCDSGASLDRSGCCIGSSTWKL